MGNKSEKIVEQAIKDPEKVYETPESVLKDSRLTRAEKDKVLHSWENDEVALMRAEEENMSSKTCCPAPVEVLEKIKKAEKILEDSKKEGKST
jgi:hypothetical protein